VMRRLAGPRKLLGPLGGYVLLARRLSGVALAPQGGRVVASLPGMRLIDLTGQRFGKWTVLAKAESRHNSTRWRCQCDCGRVKTIFGCSLRDGTSRSCRECMPRGLIDLTGQRFGSWLVLRRAADAPGGGSSRVRNRRWYARCDCGRERIVYGAALRNGTSRSCRPCAATSHGLSRTPTYHIWQGMIQRCTNPRHTEFHLYGGRGIRVCERWRASVKNFIADVGERPGPDFQLGRVDHDRDYEPGNAEWEPTKENIRYKRSSIYMDATDVRNLLTAIECGERVLWADVERYLRPDTYTANKPKRRAAA
jgi:hypothetical protein